MSLFIWRVVFYFVWFMCSPFVSYEFLLCGQIKKMVLHSATSALEELKDLLSSKYVNDEILLVHCISWWIGLFFFISRKSWLPVQDQLVRSQETLESNTIFLTYFLIFCMKWFYSLFWRRVCNKLAWSSKPFFVMFVLYVMENPIYSDMGKSMTLFQVSAFELRLNIFVHTQVLWILYLHYSWHPPPFLLECRDRVHAWILLEL